MGWTKGQSGNTAGRPKGTKNKASKQIKGFIEKILTDKQILREVRAEFRDMEGKDKLTAFVNLCRYVIPTQSAASMDMELNNLSDQQVEDLYGRLLEQLNNK